MSPHYLVKLKIAQKQPTAYCSIFCWTDSYKLLQKVIQCSFISLLEIFNSLLTKIFYILVGFYGKFIFKLNIVNFNMD